MFDQRLHLQSDVNKTAFIELRYGKIQTDCSVCLIRPPSPLSFFKGINCALSPVVCVLAHRPQPLIKTHLHAKEVELLFYLSCSLVLRIPLQHTSSNIIYYKKQTHHCLHLNFIAVLHTEKRNCFCHSVCVFVCTKLCLCAPLYMCVSMCACKRERKRKLP